MTAPQEQVMPVSTVSVTGRIRTSHPWPIQNQPLTPLPQLSRPQLFGGT